MSMTTELAQTKELAFLMSERFTMNPISCKHLNEAWREAFPDEVAVAKRMLALVEALEARDKRNAELNSTLERWAVDRAQSASELEAAEKRIAELEARTVKLPEAFKMAKSFSGLTYYYADEVNGALTAAGIKWEAQ